MLYRFLADCVLIVHVVFIVFVMLGALVAFKYSRAPLFHLPAALWGALVELFGWVCPLTPLEQRLRQVGGSSAYRESFVEHYLLPIVYPSPLTRPLQIGLGVAVIVMNIVLYAAWWRWSKRRLGQHKKHTRRA